MEQEKTKKALRFFFDIHDKDKNGVITYPEFTKMALAFCTHEEQEATNSEIVSKINYFYAPIHNQ